MSGLRKLAKERSVGAVGAQNDSSSKVSACGFPPLERAWPRGEAPGRGGFFPKGYSCGAFPLPVDGRPDVLAGVRDVSSSKFSACVFLKPVKGLVRGEAVAGRTVFLPKDFSDDDFFLSLDGRAGAEALACWAALLGFRVGIFLLTDKGSPRRKKEKK